MKAKQSLWNKNFTIMFVGSILSALGGIGLNVALGVIVFDYTQSTFLSSLFVSITSIPSLVLPLFVGALVDRKNPLKLLLKNEVLLVLVYILALIYVILFDFNYYVFLLLGIVISSLGVLSDIASQSISAQLMPTELMGRGYAIISTIYPMCNVLVTPLALFLYQSFGIEAIFIAYIITSILDVSLESQIDFDFTYNKSERKGFEEYKEDIKEGIKYLDHNLPIKMTFIFFTLVMIANGYSTLIYPYFAQSSTLTLDNYALVMSVNSLGYMFGGFFHYFVEIPKKYRYTASIIIYALFIILDSAFLFLPFALMLVAKFILGLGGMNSANIRNTAIQASIEDRYRGKVNGIFSMLMGLANIVGSLLFGILGEFISIPAAVIFAQTIYLFACIVFVLQKENKVKELYNLELAIKD